MLRRSHLAALAAVTLFSLAVLLTGCGSQQPSGSGVSENGSPSDVRATSPVDPKALPLHVSNTKVGGGDRAVITTSKGSIEIAFYNDKAPNTVASFVELARASFFDGTKFHRVEPGLLIQGGDPLSRTDDPAVGTGGPPWRLKAEFSDTPHVAGTVAMARTQDPDSAGSQFYICLAPLPDLNGKYTVFAHVTKGMEVVKAIKPGDVISSVKIIRRS